MCQLLFMVRVTGLEPVRRETHAPQTCLSAYSSTAAKNELIIPIPAYFVNSFFLDFFQQVKNYCFLS